MAGKWKEFAIGDLVERVIDNRGKNPPYTDKGYEVIETGCVSGTSRFPDYSLVKKYVDQNTYETWFRSGHPDADDILLITVGNGIGSISIMPEKRGVITQNLIGLKIDSGADSNFIYYHLSQRHVFEYLQNLNIGSAQPSLKVPHLLSVTLIVPPLPEQRAIAHILGSLDDKIELNRQMNATLEGMAQALFKSWFVDFDPVIDNALAAGNPIPEELDDRAEVRRAALADGTANREAAKPFPAGFQHTEELGWIPVGWGLESFADAPFEILDGDRGKNYPKRTEFTNVGYCVFLNAGNVTSNGFDFNSTGFISMERDQLLGKGKMRRHDIVLTTRGTVGNFAYYDNEILFDNMRINSGMVILRSDGGAASALFLLQYLKTDFFTTQVKALTSGSAQPQLPIRDIKKLIIIKPGEQNVVLAFTKIAASITEKTAKQARESSSLTELRDTLLPKLISGELRIPDAEKLAKEALA